MIFKYSRSHSIMKGLHSLTPMFSPLDTCPRSPTETDLIISPQSSLFIPFKDLRKEDPQEKFKFSKFLQAQKVYHFFERALFFKWYPTQKKATLWFFSLSTKKMLFLLEIIPSSRFLHLYCQLNWATLSLTKDRPIESMINFDPFTKQMSYDDINITVMKSCQLKTMFSFNTNPQM